MLMFFKRILKKKNTCYTNDTAYAAIVENCTRSHKLSESNPFNLMFSF